MQYITAHEKQRYLVTGSWIVKTRVVEAEKQFELLLKMQIITWPPEVEP
jgi:hypothetical protein